ATSSSEAAAAFASAATSSRSAIRPTLMRFLRTRDRRAIAVSGKYRRCGAAHQPHPMTSDFPITNSRAARGSTLGLLTQFVIVPKFPASARKGAPGEAGRAFFVLCLRLSSLRPYYWTACLAAAISGAHSGRLYMLKRILAASAAIGLAVGAAQAQEVKVGV